MPADIDDITVITGPEVWESLEENVKGTTYTHSGLLPGTDRWYRIVSKKGTTVRGDESGAQARGNTLDAGRPGTPVDLVAESAKDSSFPTANERGVLLFWNKTVEIGVDPLDGYTVQRRIDKGTVEGDWVIIEDDSESMTTSYHDDTELVTDETERVYRVAARSGDGVGNWSNMAYFPATHESLVTASDAAAGTATIMWQPITGATSYHVAVITDDGNYTLVSGTYTEITDVSDREHMFTGLTSGTAYIFAVIGEIEDGTYSGLAFQRMALQ